MADGGKPQTLPGVLGGVHRRLHLINESFRGGSVIGCQQHQLDGAAHRQLFVERRRVDGGEPGRHGLTEPRNGAGVPGCDSSIRDERGRRNVPVPDRVHLDCGDAGHGFHLFDVVSLVAAKGLGLEAVKDTLAENLRVLLIISGD